MSNCFMTPWTEACQGFSLFMGFPRQEYWSEFPFPSQGNFDDPEMKLVSPAFQDSFPLSHQGSPYIHAYIIYKYTYILGSLFPFKFCYNTFYFWRFSQSVPVPMPFILFYFMVFNSLFFSYHYFSHITLSFLQIIHVGIIDCLVHILCSVFSFYLIFITFCKIKGSSKKKH